MVGGIRCNWDFEKGLTNFVEIVEVERVVQLRRVARLVLVIATA